MRILLPLLLATVTLGFAAEPGDPAGDPAKALLARWREHPSHAAAHRLKCHLVEACGKRHRLDEEGVHLGEVLRAWDALLSLDPHAVRKTMPADAREKRDARMRQLAEQGKDDWDDLSVEEQLALLSQPWWETQGEERSGVVRTWTDSVELMHGWTRRMREEHGGSLPQGVAAKLMVRLLRCVALIHRRYDPVLARRHAVQDSSTMHGLTPKQVAEKVAERRRQAALSDRILHQSAIEHLYASAQARLGPWFTTLAADAGLDRTGQDLLLDCVGVSPARAEAFRAGKDTLRNIPVPKPAGEPVDGAKHEVDEK